MLVALFRPFGRTGARVLDRRINQAKFTEHELGSALVMEPGNKPKKRQAAMAVGTCVKSVHSLSYRKFCKSFSLHLLPKLPSFFLLLRHCCGKALRPVFQLNTARVQV